MAPLENQPEIGEEIEVVTYMQTILEFLVLMVPVAFFIVGFAIFLMGGYMTAKTRKIENAIFASQG